MRGQTADIFTISPFSVKISAKTLIWSAHVSRVYPLYSLSVDGSHRENPRPSHQKQSDSPLTTICVTIASTL